MAVPSELPPQASSDTMSVSPTAGNSSPSPAPTNGTDNGAATHPFSQDLPAIRASQLSAAFASISEQLAQASDIFAGYQSTSSSAQDLIRANGHRQHDVVQEEGRLTPELESLHARLDAIERTQSVLSNDVESIKAQIESEHTRVSTPMPSASNGNSTAALPPSVAASNGKVEDLEKKMKEMADTIKLELVARFVKLDFCKLWYQITYAIQSCYTDRIACTPVCTTRPPQCPRCRSWLLPRRTASHHLISPQRRESSNILPVA